MTSDLDIISTPTIGSGTLGVVTLIQNYFDTIEFSITLSPDTAFVSTGGPHHAFAFNLDLASPYTISFDSPDNGMFVYSGGPATNTPYGTFSNIIDCPGCGPGASHAYSGVLAFTITAESGLSFDNIVANAGGYLFSADVIGPAGGTGNIASMAPVPEPNTYAMLLVGIGLIGLSMRKKKEDDI